MVRGVEGQHQKSVMHRCCEPVFDLRLSPWAMNRLWRCRHLNAHSESGHAVLAYSYPPVDYLFVWVELQAVWMRSKAFAVVGVEVGD